MTILYLMEGLYLLIISALGVLIFWAVRFSVARVSSVIDNLTDTVNKLTESINMLKVLLDNVKDDVVDIKGLLKEHADKIITLEKRQAACKTCRKAME